jgi:hypothetical protein
MVGRCGLAEKHRFTPLAGRIYPLLKVRIGAGTTFNEQTTP